MFNHAGFNTVLVVLVIVGVIAYFFRTQLAAKIASLRGKAPDVPPPPPIVNPPAPKP